MRYMRLTKNIYKDKILFKFCGPLLEKDLNRVRKETAKEIITMIRNCYGDISVIAKIAKKYGVEVQNEY